jgi:hypothetical protein
MLNCFIIIRIRCSGGLLGVLDATHELLLLRVLRRRHAVISNAPHEVLKVSDWINIFVGHGLPLRCLLRAARNVPVVLLVGLAVAVLDLLRIKCRLLGVAKQVIGRVGRIHLIR